LGEALLDAAAEAMPHYQLDDFFAAAFPAKLQPMWTEWRGGREMRGA
jgi:hypothetical protein